MISKEAKKNHDQLFPDHDSKLKQTDPELVEIFDNFAFDEVSSYGVLDNRTRLLAILAVLLGSQSLGEFRVMLKRALNAGVSPTEIRELI